MQAVWLPLALYCVVTGAVAAQADPAPGFPSKPIRWVVGFAPGGSNDIIARAIGARLAEIWGQQVIVDNRPGAGGMVGGDIVARAAPDGYTVLFATGGPNIGNPLLSKQAPYRVGDFSYVVVAVAAPMILVINPSFPAKTPREFVDYLKAHPGKVNWGSAGINSTPHVSMAIFTAATGVNLTHVPYKGAAPALLDIVSGSIAGMHTSLASADAQIRNGRIRVLAIAGSKRLDSHPEVPTLAEAGFKDAEAPNFYGMAAPVRTPPALVRKLNAGVNEALQHPEVRRRMLDLGLNIVGGTPEEATKFVLGQADRVRRLIKAGVLTPQ